MFSTEDKAVEWLESTTWSESPICLHCGGIENIGEYKFKKFTYWYKNRYKSFTIKTGKIMHSSKIGVQM
ncbi:MAG: hypothetical protein M2R45_04682 [Verrucomicrobia subdivision 3 bacterium]|nr:hypothetical protein [Limisphaerales bacterium]MCS1416605.1 hypothetical protein [Limisphaerales bacterium]